ncbi:porin [Rhizobium sp. 9140]|uniref:porin n=1 Tax=Rhizobium sp. 9140 TaxID=1761900 RepID=UPI000799AD0F|nr:porin [Rhizobium sp. 9140]CZT34641.1 Porin subfamily protein [Rhizobium sp. 9140]
MNIKSLLLGSAAALAAVSGAHAADAIVAAEPEAMEYVRVCDAFGKGYFYIPGTETCLKIGGYVRTQIAYDEDYTQAGADWNPLTRGYLTFEAKSDTEFGALTGYINLETNDDGDTHLDGAWISIAGFDVGYLYNWWDDGLSGETDDIGSDNTLSNEARYTYDTGAFQVGAAVTELRGGGLVDPGTNDDVGASGLVGFTVGGVTGQFIGSYDFDAEESAFRGILTADVGPGKLGFAAVYSTDPNYFYSTSEWAVAAEYKIKATEKLFITPAAQYYGDYGFVNGKDAWKVGVTAGYQITDGLRTLATVNYKDVDREDEKWTGFLRLQRDF